MRKLIITAAVAFLFCSKIIRKILRVVKRTHYKLESRCAVLMHTDKKVTPSLEISKGIPRREEVCHYKRLFISHSGEVFPCCLRWGDPRMKIGHIYDKDLLESIKRFDTRCSCERFLLRKGLEAERIQVDFLNIELSLECQGNCAMCCVGAPNWKGTYRYYDYLTHLIEALGPKRILVQGGEVLVQREALEWVEKTKNTHPDIAFSLVTNGNVDMRMVDAVNRLFKRAIISFVGFEPLTYERIMGMNIEKAKNFVEDLTKNGKIEVVPKYLLTPLNAHTTDLFLSWAISLEPTEIFVFSCGGFDQYINRNTPDHYWDKIFERTRQKVKRTIVDNISNLRAGNTKVYFTVDSIKTLKLFSEWSSFIKENNLQDSVAAIPSLTEI